MTEERHRFDLLESIDLIASLPLQDIQCSLIHVDVHLLNVRYLFFCAD